MREINLTPTHSANGNGTTPNPPITIYDTSGPYTDPNVTIDVRAGLAPLRRAWIDGRQDAEELAQMSSQYGRLRAPDPKLADLRFRHIRKPLRAKAGRNVTQLHYAAKVSSRRKWNSSPSGRTNPANGATRPRPHRTAMVVACRNIPARPGEPIFPDRITPEFVARRSGPRPRDHSGQYQSPGKRADDHRPQLPGEDQFQHRQLRRRLIDRRRSGKDDLVDPLGRRHGDGSLDRQKHSRDARMDHPQFAGADRHGADLPGAGKSRTARPKT